MIDGIRPSEEIVGREPVRRASGGGAIYAHDCGGETLVWDILSNGLLILECDCGLVPTELAEDLGIGRGRLQAVELDISARELVYRTLAFSPYDKEALALLALLGPGE